MERYNSIDAFRMNLVDRLLVDRLLVIRLDDIVRLYKDQKGRDPETIASIQKDLHEVGGLSGASVQRAALRAAIEERLRILDILEFINPSS